jgi:hypothetical protein
MHKLFLFKVDFGSILAHSCAQSYSDYLQSVTPPKKKYCSLQKNFHYPKLPNNSLPPPHFVKARGKNITGITENNLEKEKYFWGAE